MEQCDCTWKIFWITCSTAGTSRSGSPQYWTKFSRTQTILAKSTRVGKTGIELGSGLGLCGILLSLCGVNMTLTGSELRIAKNHEFCYYARALGSWIYIPLARLMQMGEKKFYRYSKKMHVGMLANVTVLLLGFPRHQHAHIPVSVVIFGAIPLPL